MKKILFAIILIMPTYLWAQEPLNLPNVPSEEVTPRAEPEISLPPALVLPDVESQIIEIGTHKFGGLNLWLPVNQVPKEQAIVLNNLLPKGKSLEKRWGFQKANDNDSTLLSGVYGVGIGGATAQIIVASAESLCYAALGADLNFIGFDTTEAVLTYFVSTPFGVVVLNGEDSARIWIDRDTIKALGIVDTGTVDNDSTVGGDTAWVADSSAAWTADEWVGYWLKCGSPTAYFEIIDNGDNWFHVKLCGDSCDAGSTFQLLSRPDSVGASLGYPIGQAGTYFQDQFFISSAYWENRIYYSAERDPDDIPPENIINLDMDVHDEIVAMVLFNSNLVVFGKYSIYGITPSRVATAITKSLGCVAPKTVAVGDDFVYFLSADGVYRFKGNIYGSFSYKLEKISHLIDDYLEGIEPTYLEYCGGVYYNNQYWLSYDRDHILVFDERTQEWYPQGFGFSNVLISPPDYSRYDLILPDGDGDTTDWTPSTGSDHYALVDETHSSPNDADYVSVGVNDKNEQFTFANLGSMPPGANIQSVTLYIRAKHSRFGNKIIVNTKSGGTSYPVDTLTLSYAWVDYVVTMETDPSDGNAWTTADVNGLGVNLISVRPTDENVYVSQLEAGISFQAAINANMFFSGRDKPFLYQYGGTFDDDTSGTFGEVYGEPVIATYQSGWLDNDLPVDDKLLRQFYLQTESDSGDVWIYYYKDYGTTPSDSDLVHLGDKRTSWWMLGEKVVGKNFSFKVENKSNVDSLVIKGWSAILNNLGARGGE